MIASAVGPLAEQVVALEERIVAVAGMRDDQRLHGHGVFFHEVRDARIGIDHDLVGEPLHAAAVALLVADEFLAVRPVRVADRQAVGGIGVEHLLGADDLDLVGIGVEAELVDGDLADLGVVFLDELERPLPAARNRVARAIRPKGAPGSLRLPPEEIPQHRIDLAPLAHFAHREMLRGDALVGRRERRQGVSRSGTSM